MGGPWEKFQAQQPAPVEDGPWTKFQATAPAAQDSVVIAAPPSMPKVGDTWTDPETGEQKTIVEPSLTRKPGEYTLSDVQSRMSSLAQGSPQLPDMAPLGPATVGPAASQPELASAARDNDFTNKVLDNTAPQDISLTRQILGAQRASDRSALETGAREAINTAGLGLPRLATAAFSNVPLANEHEIEKAADDAGRVAHPRAAQAGQLFGLAAQAAATPESAIATPLRAAVTGGLLSGGQAAVETRGDVGATLNEGVKGALLGGAGGSLLGPAQSSTKTFALENAPSRDALKQFAQDSYDTARQSGVQYAPQPVSESARQIADALQSQGFRELNQPKTFRVLDELNSFGNKPIGIDDLESVRRAAQKIATDPVETASAGFVRRGIDDLLDRTKPQDVIAGDPEAAAAAIQDARGNYAALKRSDKLNEAIDNARLQADASGSGANFDNALRQNFKGILKDKKAMASFSDEEEAAMRDVVKGTTVQNIARLVSKASPQHPLTASIIGAGGYAALGPAALAIPAVGHLAKRYAENATLRNAERAELLTRARSPGFERVVDALASTSQTPRLPHGSQLVLRALMDRASPGYAQSQQGQSGR